MLTRFTENTCLDQYLKFVLSWKYRTYRFKLQIQTYEFLLTPSFCYSYRTSKDDRRDSLIHKHIHFNHHLSRTELSISPKRILTLIGRWPAPTPEPQLHENKGAVKWMSTAEIYYVINEQSILLVNTLYRGETGWCQELSSFDETSMWMMSVVLLVSNGERLSCILDTSEVGCRNWGVMSLPSLMCCNSKWEKLEKSGFVLFLSKD